MKYAIIDISSSSISLLIAAGDKRFDVLTRARENVSILHYAEDGNLSERGVERLAENLEKMKEICRREKVDKCYVVSTASMRNFGNFEWVAEELKKRAGVFVNLLDGEEEAYCDYVSNLRYKAFDRAILVDLGGGSIELCDLSKNKEGALTCLAFGPVQLGKKFVAKVQPTEEESKQIKKYVRRKLEKAGISADGGFATAVLVGATNRSIYEIYLDYFDETESADGEKRIEYAKLKKLCKHLVRSSERSMLILKNAPEKVFTLTTAAVALKTILSYYGVSNICVSDFGVKEGYLSLVTGGEKTGEETDVYAPSPSENTQVSVSQIVLPAVAPKRRGRPRKKIGSDEAVTRESGKKTAKKRKPKKSVEAKKVAAQAEEEKPMKIAETPIEETAIGEPATATESKPTRQRRSTEKVIAQAEEEKPTETAETPIEETAIGEPAPATESKPTRRRRSAKKVVAQAEEKKTTDIAEKPLGETAGGEIDGEGTAPAGAEAEDGAR